MWTFNVRQNSGQIEVRQEQKVVPSQTRGIRWSSSLPIFSHVSHPSRPNSHWDNARN